MPDSAMSESRPAVLRHTVLPPVFGPVMTSRLKPWPRRTSMGTTSRRSSLPAMEACLFCSRKRCSRRGWRAARSQSWPCGLMSGASIEKSRLIVRLGGDQVEPGQEVDGEGERLGHLGDLAGEPAQDAADLAVFVALEDGPLGTEAGDAGGFDEDRLAGGTGAMDDALDLVAVVDGDGQDVVVAADGGVGIAEDLAKLRVAEHAADDLLDALVEVGELVANLGQLAAGHVEDVAPAVDAAGDRAGDVAHVLDGREQLDEPAVPRASAACDSGTCGRCRRACRRLRAAVRR